MKGDAKSERDEHWEAFLAIAERNADKDPEEVERDVAEELEAMRRERRAAEAAAATLGTPRGDS